MIIYAWALVHMTNLRAEVIIHGLSWVINPGLHLKCQLFIRLDIFPSCRGLSKCDGAFENKLNAKYTIKFPRLAVVFFYSSKNGIYRPDKPVSIRRSSSQLYFFSMNQTNFQKIALQGLKSRFFAERDAKFRPWIFEIHDDLIHFLSEIELLKSFASQTTSLSSTFALSFCLVFNWQKMCQFYVPPSCFTRFIFWKFSKICSRLLIIFRLVFIDQVLTIHYF